MAESGRNLDSIPYDVFYQIASGLDCHDFINLSRVNRTLSGMMRDESLARKTIEEHLLYTKEGQEAHRTRQGYRQAVGHLFDIKEATANAQPYAVAHIAYGSTLLYNDGHLCYVHGAEIRVLDVHGSSSTEQVLDLPQMLCRIFTRIPIQLDCISLALLHANDGVLAFLIRLTDRAEDWLFAVDVAPRPTRPSTGRLRFHTRLESTSRLFVRHNRSFLYYGTHSALGYHGHRKWEICCIDLNMRQQRTTQPWNLENFAGHEIGQTVCFEMHRECLYAVSTLVNFEEAEVDWTSYYMWACLAPTTETTRPVKLRRIWRRQHREGPINDTWTDLSLRKDEATDRLVILECRREWLNGGSENCRIYYKQPLPQPEEVSGHESHAAGALPAHHRPPLPVDDPLAKTIDSSSKYNYEPPQKRVRRDYHPEYDNRTEPWQQQQRRDFILAKTKYRTYNLLSSTFVDIVNDPEPTAAGPGCQDRLRLRMVSRKRKSPIDEHGEYGEPGRLFCVDPDLVDGDGKPLKYSEERFESRGARFWPPDITPECGDGQAYEKLYALLCPNNKARKVHAIADERSIIYMVDPSTEVPRNVPLGSKAIICITFDPRICFTGMKRLGDDGSGERPANKDDGKRRNSTLVSADSEHGTLGRPVGIDLPCAADLDPGHQWVTIHCTGAGAGTGSPATSGSLFRVDDLANSRRRLLSEQPAMYRQIDRAYWVR